MRLILTSATCLIIFLVSNVYSTESHPGEEALSKPAGESFYIIPDQPGSPFKLGVAITPDQNTRYMDISSHSSHLYSFDNDHKRTRHANVSTVVRIALDEFKCFSGLSHRINYVEKTMSGYTQKLKLSGELNLDSRNADPVGYMEQVNLVAEISKEENPAPFTRNRIKSISNQFVINKLTWGMGLYFNRQAISFKLGLGDAIKIQSFIGNNDVCVGVKFRISI